MHATSTLQDTKTTLLETSQVQYMPYAATNAFSKLAVDYAQGNAKLQPFYKHPVNMDGILAAIEARKNFPQQRSVLVQALQEQYAGYTLAPTQAANLAALLHPNTFTVTTAHQPNIFTGPLYFIYKILHAIKLAYELQQQLPQYNFVPFYYMGSEDADLDELGHIFLDGEKVKWETSQTGAVGRMHNKGLDKIIARLDGEFGHLPFGREMVELCSNAYTKHTNVQQATLYLVNELFKAYGLLVLIPDNAKLKAVFNPVIEKELTEQFSHPLVEATAAKISEHYKVQASGRDINLFYLADTGARERIELANGVYTVPALNLQFSQTEILAVLAAHPERFSANVILRGVFQETILPNIAFIGGGGEIAYWLELQDVFNAVQVPYPMLILRNSFLIKEEKEQQLQEKLGLTANQLFWGELELMNFFARKNAPHRLHTQPEQEQLNQLYIQLQHLAEGIDPTLKAHVAALQARAAQGLDQLDKKLLRAARRKQGETQVHIQQLRRKLFPNNNLQERTDNFMPLFAKYGPELIDVLYKHSCTLEQQFALLDI